jgi:VRR-NUC domain
MGTDPASLPDAFKKLMSTTDRQAVAAAAGHPKAAFTSEEATRKYLVRLERQEQNTLVSWLSLQEEAGKLTFDWSRTDRRTTNRKGMPDFRIYRDGQALLGEMKMEGAKLSPDQEQMREKFLRSGTEVELWSSAEAAIRATRNWLWTQFQTLGRRTIP